MNTQVIPKDYQHVSPAGAEVRLLMDNHLGGMAHCTLKAGTISKVVRHKTVSEFWHVIGGEGAIWRKLNNEESITPLTIGISIDIPLGAEFQYRANTEDLVFLCITMPPWTGSDEASHVEQGAWIP